MVREVWCVGPCQEWQTLHVLGGAWWGKVLLGFDCCWPRIWLAGRGRESPGGESLSFALPKESNQRKGNPVTCVFLRYSPAACPGIEHRLTKPKTPQTNGMVERFNGRLSQMLRSHHFNSTEDLEKTLHRFVWLYNHHLPQ